MATDIRTAELKTPVDLAEYLFRRLHQLGVRGVHGVPGDFNLVISSLLIIYTSILAAKYLKVALDYIPQTGLNWVGNTNELNAGTLSASIIP